MTGNWICRLSGGAFGLCSCFFFPKEVYQANCETHHSITTLHCTVADPGEGPGGQPPPPVLDQNEAWRAEKETAPPLISGSGWLGPPLSEGLDDCTPLISGSGWPCPPLSEGLDDRTPPYLRVWMTVPPLIWRSGWPHPPLSQGLDDRAPPYLKVWIGHCCNLSRINCHQDWPLWYSSGFSYVLWKFFRGLTEQSGGETPNYGFIKWVGKLKLVTTQAD